MSIDWEAAVRDPGRLAALASSGLVGSGPEDAFDRLTDLAVALTGAPQGCITLVGARCTTAKSSVGFPEGVELVAPVEETFCRFVVGTGRPMLVEDAQNDPRTRGDAAIELYGASAWIGYPIHDAEGSVLGTFCLMDSAPREWTARDIHIVATLARAASSEIALRRCQQEAAVLRAELDALRAALGSGKRA